MRYLQHMWKLGMQHDHIRLLINMHYLLLVVYSCGYRPGVRKTGTGIVMDGNGDKSSNIGSLEKTLIISTIFYHFWLGMVMYPQVCGDSHVTCLYSFSEIL